MLSLFDNLFNDNAKGCKPDILIPIPKRHTTS